MAQDDLVSSVRGKNLFFTRSFEETVTASQVVFVCINTPLKTSGIGSGQAADLSRSAPPPCPSPAIFNLSALIRAAAAGRTPRAASPPPPRAPAKSWSRAAPSPSRRARLCARCSTPSAPAPSRSSVSRHSTVAAPPSRSSNPLRSCSPLHSRRPDPHAPAAAAAAAAAARPLSAKINSPLVSSHPPD
jgi:hypothetical protein